MGQDRIYYNTEYRKKIKALSKFNIFIKDRISKKDVVQEIRLKKKKELLGPLVYLNLFKFYYIIKKVYDVWIYKINYDLKLSLKFYQLKYIEKKNIHKFIKNQLILEYFYNGLIYFLLIMNWIWVNEWDKWSSFTDILEYNFLNLTVLYKYINNYFFDFLSYMYKRYKYILFGFFYDSNFIDNSINVFNIACFISLKLFYVLYNVEDIKLEHEKNFVKKEKWKDIRITVFNYLDINLLKDYYNLSFFSFCNYEFHIIFNNYKVHFITCTFFEYWINLIIEYNYNSYINKKKDYSNFESNDIKQLCTQIFKTNFFPIRVRYNLFISNLDYFIFLKDFTYNFYIKNCEYFYEFSSQRKLFLKYNNPLSINKGYLTLWNYDKLYKKLLLFLPDYLHNSFNLFRVKKIKYFSNFEYMRDNINVDSIINLFIKDINIKFLYKIRKSNHFFFSIDRFFEFNLIDFYNLYNRMESYKDVMAINSVYEYRFANSSFKTLDEFMLTIFKTPLENFIYFDNLYKNASYEIVFNVYREIAQNNFLEDIINIEKNNNYEFFLQFLRFFSKLSRIRIYSFKFFLLWDLLKHENRESLLRIDVFRRFYYRFKKKKIFRLIQKFKRKMFYNKWSIKNFYKIMKYNTMFYLDIYSIFILFSGWIYETLFFFKYNLFIQIYNRFFNLLFFYDNFKYTLILKQFYIQLAYHNVDFCLIFILLNFNKIKRNYNYNFINNRNRINNNYIYRKYMLNTWLDNRYYNNLFDDLYFFEKGKYSPYLSKWILRYFYEKAELYMFYSESLRNNYINKERLFL